MRKNQQRHSSKVKLALLIVSFFAIFSYIYRAPIQRKNAPQPSHKSRPQAPKPQSTIQKSSVFVPSWQLPDSQLQLTDPIDPARPIDQDIYFAISPDSTGTFVRDSALTSLTRFTQVSPKTSLLTIKMIQEEINSQILHSPQAQKTLIKEAITHARTYGFSGIVLDLEHSVLPFKEVRTSITSFVKNFSSAAREQKLTFDMTLYGDTYHRARPYDVADLEPHVDMFYIMAYDFHKAFGEPGPNFPLNCGPSEAPIYSYCLTQLLDDFLNDVPADKITLVHGLYGYTWDVDEQNRPAEPAIAHTFAQLENITSACPNNPCTFKIDPVSAETTHSYTENGRKFITWYETPTSIQKKSAYALSRGVSRIAYWAYGYYK